MSEFKIRNAHPNRLVCFLRLRTTCRRRETILSRRFQAQFRLEPLTGEPIYQNNKKRTPPRDRVWLDILWLRSVCLTANFSAVPKRQVHESVPLGDQ